MVNFFNNKKYYHVDYIWHTFADISHHITMFFLELIILHLGFFIQNSLANCSYFLYIVNTKSL